MYEAGLRTRKVFTSVANCKFSKKLQPVPVCFRFNSTNDSREFSPGGLSGSAMKIATAGVGRQQKKASGERIPKSRTMRVGLRARQEKGIVLTDDEMMKLIGEQWLLFAPFAYGEYLQKGRGAILIKLAEATTTGRGLMIDPVYIADNSEDLKRRGGWPHDEGGKTINLISSYDPEQMIIIILAHKSGWINTVYRHPKIQILSRLISELNGEASMSRFQLLDHGPVARSSFW